MTNSQPRAVETTAAPAVTPTMPDANRLYSLDQFRGYAVAAMFVVNFCGNLKFTPDWIKHHDTYFSYADSIAPAFLFAAGFSFRLTMRRRIPRDGKAAAWGHAIWRSLALVAISVAMYGFNGAIAKNWDEVNSEQLWNFVAALLKANLWETLAIIGLSQIIALPFIAGRTALVVGGMVGLVVGHLLLSYSFNFDFIYAQPNWLDAYWGAANQTAWDGGFFGLMMWSSIMLGGAWAHDLVVGYPPGRAAANLLACGALVMTIAYGLSCLTTFYDVPPDTPANPRDLATSPVFPTSEQRESAQLRLAELPFSGSPPKNLQQFQEWEAQGKTTDPPRVRPYNYWMMSTRIMTLTFVLFSVGFSMAVLAAFVIVTDLWGMQLGVFRTFGTNALAAYYLHQSIKTATYDLVPKDSPLWWCLVGLAIFFTMTYVFVRFLEKQRIFIRL
ncbi:MAG: heparan-alpha-glucosaminide N-acetyltransferase domain-containing protein [Planctomycetaceae bacterium]